MAQNVNIGSIIISPLWENTDSGYLGYFEASLSLIALIQLNEAIIYIFVGAKKFLFVMHTGRWEKLIMLIIQVYLPLKKIVPYEYWWLSNKSGVFVEPFHSQNDWRLVMVNNESEQSMVLPHLLDSIIVKTISPTFVGKKKRRVHLVHRVILLDQ